MPLRREPPTLCALAEAVLTKIVTFRVRVLLQCGSCSPHTLHYLEEVFSSLAPSLAMDLALKALRCTDLICERLPLPPHFLHLLVHSLIHDQTVAFPITTLQSYQLRQAVLNRMCELKHLQTYHSLDHLHENFNIIETLQRMQSLTNLKQVFLRYWCSDEIAHLLAESCPNLQLLDAQQSVSLTDSSVPYLSLCTRLKVLLVNSTGISDNGYELLLANLPLLQKIGPCHRLNSIIARVKRNHRTFSPLSLTEYESSDIPDENVSCMCPHLTTVHLLGTKHSVSKESKLPHRVTCFTVQCLLDNGHYLSTLFISDLVHLDLIECAVVQETMSAIANICENLRVLRFKLPQFSGDLRLVTQKKAPFPYLEELDIPDSILAIDILMVSHRIRHVHIDQPQKSSPFSFQVPIWTDQVLQTLLDRNKFQFLESFYLSTICNFSIKSIFNFVEACLSLHHLGNIRSWGHGWEEKILKLNPCLRKTNLAIELVH